MSVPFKDTYFYRTPPIAISEKRKLLMPVCTLLQNGMTLFVPIHSMEVQFCRYMKPALQNLRTHCATDYTNYATLLLKAQRQI